MIRYLTLHLDTNKSKGTVCNKKGYWCTWTWHTVSNFILRHILN